MNIAIDASRLTNNVKTGVEEYSWQIISRLIYNNQHNITLFSPLPKPKKLGQLPNKVNWKIIKANKFWTQLRFSIELILHSNFDVIYIPSHVIPMINRGKFVVTIHDIAFVDYPELYSFWDRMYQLISLKKALKSAQTIIVPSHSTKKNIEATFRPSSKIIEVIYHGIDRNRFKINKNRLDLGFGIKKPYILYSGRIESKKNIATLIEAYGLLRLESSIRHQLILVGKPGRLGYPEISQAITKLPPNIGKDIIETDYVTDESYTKIMQNADFYVMPSLYEGFGLPILEAMSCGVPVLASNTTGLKEIVGNAGILFDPKNPFKLAVALSKLIHHTKEKEALIVKGINHAKNFDWDVAAQKTLLILEKVGQS